MEKLPENNINFATIVISCRSEQDFIGQCLDSLTSQNYPKDCLEVLVVDGMSTDKTREIIGNYCKKFSFIKLLDNPKKFTPSAFNIGIKNAKGDYIIIMGAHAEYQNDYISKCVAHLEESGADNVGGVMVAKPKTKTAVALAIAGALASPFGAGGSFRLKADKPQETDTVFGGCYRREVFERIGLFDERMVRSQDMEFNIRLKRSGGKIMIFPDIVVNYYPKSGFGDFFIHNMQDGIWAIYPLKIMKSPLKLRHYLPLLFVSSFIGLVMLSLIWRPALFLLLAEVVLYLVAGVYFSVKAGVAEKKFALVFLMPIAFAARHFGYGIGSCCGVFKLIFGK